MPTIKGSTKAIAILRDVIATWPKIRDRLMTLLPIVGSGAVTVKQTRDSVTIYAPVVDDQEIPTNPDGSSWFKIKSNSSVGTNQWNYKGRVMKSGDTSSLTGLDETADTTEFDLRNAVESVALGGMSDIGSLNAIATDSVVRAWPEIRNGVRVYVFERVNDVECPA